MILLDSREKPDVIKPVQAYLAKHCIDSEVLQLETGDFVIICDNGTPVCIEHKRFPDLVLSVKDGHLIKQVDAMLNAYEHVHLLISGPTMQVYSQGPLAIAPFRGYKNTPAYNVIDIRRLVGTLSTIQKAGVTVDWWPMNGEIGAYLRHVKYYYERGEHDSHVVRPRRLTFVRRGGLVEGLERLAISGIGTSKAEALAERFASLHALANAELKELEAVKTIGKKNAASIYHYFRNEAA